MNESKLKIEESTVVSTLNVLIYKPTDEQTQSEHRILNDWMLARLVCNRPYNYFNNQTLYQVIDDWTMRWNGYVSPLTSLDETSSNIFLNFTRNLVIQYLAKVAMSQVEPKILAVNKKTRLSNQQFSDVLKDLNRFSLDNENADSKYLQAALEATVKGTAIVYEGYLRSKSKKKIPISYDSETGKVKTRDEEFTDFDDCYQQLVRLEDFYIANPFVSDIQEQPYVIWKKTTSYYEASKEFGNFKMFKYVKPGSFRILSEPTTFYNQDIYTEIQPNQVQILRYYNRKDNLHIIMANGIVLYDGPIPFLHQKYPFAKYIFEPFGNDFFWGCGAPFKFMGEQDTENTFVNMMIDKTYGSLLPYGLSSDLDDLIEDDTLAPNKIRKVGDINKWKFDTLPGVNAGESNMFQMFMNLIKENSGMASGADQFSPKGGKLNVRQVLLKQQEQMQKISFSMNFLEDGERDRTELRLKNILQFYSIPKIEKITGKNGKEIEQLVYKEAVLNNAKLSDGMMGTKIIKLINDEGMDENEKMKLQDELSVQEAMGELQGQATEAVAVPVSMFENFDIKIQIVKNSSYEKNQALDQAAAMDYAKWRITMAQMGVPTDLNELAKYVDETYDIETDRFTPKQGQPQPGQPGQVQPPTQPQTGQQGQTPTPGGGLAPAAPARGTGPVSLGQLNQVT